VEIMNERLEYTALFIHGEFTNAPNRSDSKRMFQTFGA
ncbi:unnamed protein product, partial [marine sediment metagenome]